MDGISPSVESLLREAVRLHLAETGQPSWYPDQYATSKLEILWPFENLYVEEVYRACGRPHSGPPEPIQGQGVYRIFAMIGADEILLYVGVTGSLRARLRQHRRRWEHLRTRVEWTPYESRPEAVAAEREAIRTERPLANLQT